MIENYMVRDLADDPIMNPVEYDKDGNEIKICPDCGKSICVCDGEY